MRLTEDHRRLLNLGGLGLQILGALLFGSVFVTFLARFGDFTDFEARARSEGFRAFGGMVLMALGGGLRSASAKDDLFAPPGRPPRTPPPPPTPQPRERPAPKAERVVMVRCPWCGSLNAEAATACEKCDGTL